MNIVPVIAKADTLTPKEIAELKKRILKELECHEVNAYQLPECEEDEDDDFKATDRQLKVRYSSRNIEIYPSSSFRSNQFHYFVLI